jgi:hypothetical protein
VFVRAYLPETLEASFLVKVKAFFPYLLSMVELESDLQSSMVDPISRQELLERT